MSLYGEGWFKAGQGRGVAQTISSKAHSQLTALSSMCTNVSVWPNGGSFNVQVCAVALKPVFHFAPPLYKTASTSSSSNIYLQINYGFCAGIISQCQIPWQCLNSAIQMLDTVGH